MDEVVCELWITAGGVLLHNPADGKSARVRSFHLLMLRAASQGRDRWPHLDWVGPVGAPSGHIESFYYLPAYAAGREGARWPY